LHETASYEPLCVKISSVVFPVEDGKKKRKGKGREGKERHKKSRKRYISPIRGEAPHKRIFTKFCTSGDMLDVIICANFGVEKLRGLGNTRGQILECFPLKWLVTLTTVLRYRAACDYLKNVNTSVYSCVKELTVVISILQAKCTKTLITAHMHPVPKCIIRFQI